LIVLKLQNLGWRFIQSDSDFTCFEINGLVPFVFLILFLLFSDVIGHVITFGSFLDFFSEFIEHHLRSRKGALF
jgi:hypothetical protein